jgi:hypothetical protein
MTLLRVEPAEDALAAGCPCCEGGGLRGFVFADEEPHAVYFAESGGMGSKPVILIGLAMGRWASDAARDERACLVFACTPDDAGGEARITPTLPALLAFPEFRDLGAPVEVEEAQAHPRYDAFRACLSAVIAQDDRLAHLRARAGRRRFSAD